MTQINHQIFSKELLKSKLNLFWKEVVEKSITSDQHILFLFRIQWSNNQFVTIGNLQKLNLEDKDYILNFILDEMIDRGEYYKESSIISMTFSYGVREGRALEKGFPTDVKYHNYSNHKLPITMNPLKYGKLLDQTGNKYTVQINDTNIVIIIKHDDENEVSFYRKGNLIYKYKDTYIDENSFTRDMGNKKFHIINDEITLTTVEKAIKFMTRIKKPWKGK